MKCYYFPGIFLINVIQKAKKFIFHIEWNPIYSSKISKILWKILRKITEYIQWIFRNPGTHPQHLCIFKLCYVSRNVTKSGDRGILQCIVFRDILSTTTYWGCQQVGVKNLKAAVKVCCQLIWFVNLHASLYLWYNHVYWAGSWILWMGQKLSSRVTKWSK